MVVGDENVLMGEEARAGRTVGQADHRHRPGFLKPDLEKTDRHQGAGRPQNLFQLNGAPRIAPVSRRRTDDGPGRRTGFSLLKGLVIWVVPSGGLDDRDDFPLMAGMLENGEPRVDDGRAFERDETGVEPGLGSDPAGITLGGIKPRQDLSQINQRFAVPSAKCHGVPIRLYAPVDLSFAIGDDTVKAVGVGHRKLDRNEQVSALAGGRDR